MCIQQEIVTGIHATQLSHLSHHDSKLILWPQLPPEVRNICLTTYKTFSPHHIANEAYQPNKPWHDNGQDKIMQDGNLVKYNH